MCVPTRILWGIFPKYIFVYVNNNSRKAEKRKKKITKIGFRKKIFGELTTDLLVKMKVQMGLFDKHFK